MLDNLPRITGAAQVVSGIMSLCVAAAVGRAGVGAPLAAVIGFVALDNIQAGARSMWSNEVTATHGGELIEWSGLVAKGYGEIAYTLIDIGLITKASSVVKMATQTENVIKLDTTTAVKVGQTIKPTEVTISIDKISLNQKNVIELKEFNAGKEASVISNTEQAIKNVDPKSLISRQNSNEISGSDIKRLVRDMKANGFDTTQPIDVAIVNGKMIIIDGHHRAAAAVKAGIKDIPIRINKVTEAQGNQLLLEAAEARSRY